MRRGVWVLVLMVGWAGRCLGASTYYVTVAGLGGEPEYEQRFTATARELDKVFRGAEGVHADTQIYTLVGKDATRARLLETIAVVARVAHADDVLVVMLIGHGSFDGVEYKMNLVGPDVTAGELASACDRVSARRQVIVNTTSASGGSVAALVRPGRAVIAATKSGTEKNATVFARYWVEALQDPSADVDKSESVSALEAFAYAERKTAAFYETQKRLATEHAVFEDTGRGEAVRAAGKGEGALLGSITLVRLGSGERAMGDGSAHGASRRELLAKREALEQGIDALKYGKAAMEPAEYKKQMTAALVQLAQVQQELDK